MPKLRSSPPPEETFFEADVMGAFLSSLRVSAANIALFSFTPPYTLRVRQHLPLVLTVTQGVLWLRCAGQPALRFGPGDTLILPRGFQGADILVSHHPDMPGQPVGTDRLWERGDFQMVEANGSDTPMRRLTLGDEGPDTMKAITFLFDLQDRLFGPIIDSLPLVMRLPASQTGDNILRFFTALDLADIGPDQPGFRYLSAQAAHLFLAHVVRSFAKDGITDGPSWMRGLSDSKITKAVAAIHANPGMRWSVGQLAAHSAMSRAAFALRFSETMGTSPADYMRAWRMHLARVALSKGDTSIADLADTLGYTTEAGFRDAFRKSCGMSPSEFARNAQNRTGHTRPENTLENN